MLIVYNIPLYLYTNRVPTQLDDKNLNLFFRICMLFIYNNNIVVSISILFIRDIEIVLLLSRLFAIVLTFLGKKWQFSINNIKTVVIYKFCLAQLIPCIKTASVSWFDYFHYITYKIFDILTPILIILIQIKILVFLFSKFSISLNK